VVAVIGGSYTAAALALVRTFKDDGGQRRRRLKWTEAYEYSPSSVARRI
jgi:hypothetical protein